MITKAARSIRVVVAIASLSLQQFASAQVLTDSFSSSVLNPAVWFQIKSLSNLSAVPANGRLEFRATTNSNVPGGSLHFAATCLEPGIGTETGSQVSLEVNLSKPATGQPNDHEGMVVLFSGVEDPAPSAGSLRARMIFVVGSRFDWWARMNVRYMSLFRVTELGDEEDYFFLQETTPGVFKDPFGPTTVNVGTLPSGAFPVYFSLVKSSAATPSWSFRVGFTSFTATSNSLFVPVVPGGMGEQPYRTVLAGFTDGNITAALTGSRTFFDNFRVASGALSHRPRNVIASQGTSTTAIDLAWSASTGATSYRVYRSPNLTIPIATVTGTTYSDPGTSPGLPTEYCIRAHSAAAGLSQRSDFVVGFRKPQAPTVSAVAPASGPLGGGTAITVTGTNFIPDQTTVTVDGVAATDVSVTSATSLTAVTPARPAGPRSVVVSTSGGSGTKTGAFTYLAAPTVASVAPASGSTAGGTTITVTGTGFVAGATVSVGGVAATGVVVVGPTSITAKTPAGPVGPKSVSVTTPGGTGIRDNAFSHVVLPPTVSAVTPTTGSSFGGTTITVTGTNFIPGATTVTVGGVAATSVSVTNPTTLTARTPAGTAGAKSVSVTTGGGTATRANAFTYVVPAPTATAVSPASGPTTGNTLITVTGTNFVTGATTVTVGGVAATSVSVTNPTTLTARTPSRPAGLASVAVITEGGSATRTNAFTYLAVPTVAAVAPASGPTTGNTLITVTGTNFVTGATTVTVGGVAATSVSVTSATTLTARTPSGALGPKAVSVTTAGGTGSRPSGFTYVAASGMPTPPGGDSGGGTGEGSSAASKSAGGSTGTVASSAASSGAGNPAAWAPDTGIPSLDGFLMLSAGAGVSWSPCGEAPETDLDADGEADLCQLRRGDVDLDGDVDATDGELLFSLIGRESADGIADLDRDGWVTLLDVAIARSGGATLASTPR